MPETIDLFVPLDELEHVAELQLVLSRLTTRGGAQRMITLLRLEELKPSSPLPLRATSGQRSR